jgi:hypothetical protein
MLAAPSRCLGGPMGPHEPRMLTSAERAIRVACDRRPRPGAQRTRSPASTASARPHAAREGLARAPRQAQDRRKAHSRAGPTDPPAARRRGLGHASARRARSHRAAPPCRHRRPHSRTRTGRRAGGRRRHQSRDCSDAVYERPHGRIAPDEDRPRAGDSLARAQLAAALSTAAAATTETVKTN